MDVYEVKICDVINFIDYATPSELEKIKRRMLQSTSDDFITADNLYDREKLLLFKEAMNKYNLDELREKLK